MLLCLRTFPITNGENYSPWAGVKCILAASNFLALPTPDRAAVLDLS